MSLYDEETNEIDEIAKTLGVDLELWSTKEELDQYVDSLPLSDTDKRMVKKTAKTVRASINQGQNGIRETPQGYAYCGKDGVKQLTDCTFTNIRVTKLLNDGPHVTIMDINNGNRIIKGAVFSGKHMASVSEFRTQLEKTAEGVLYQNVTPTEFGHLRLHIKNELNKRYLESINFLGYRYDENDIPYLAFAKEGSLYTLHPGIEEAMGDKYYHEFAETKQPRYIMRNCEIEEWKEITKRILENFPYMNETIKMTIAIAWALATPLKHITDTDDNCLGSEARFPVLSIAGTPGAGKTTITKYLMQMLGYNSTGGSFTKAFTLIKNLSESNAQPVWIDEYKVDSAQKQASSLSLNDLMRKAYDSGIEERGRPDQTMTSYHLIAPVLISGESELSDQATLERTIQLHFTAQTMEEQFRENDSYNELSAMSNASKQKFAMGFHKWVLNNYKNWNQWIEEAQEINGKVSGKEIKARNKNKSMFIALGMVIARNLSEEVGADSKAYSTQKTEEAILFIHQSIGNDGTTANNTLEYKLVEFLAENWYSGTLMGGTAQPIVSADTTGTQMRFVTTAWVHRFGEFMRGEYGGVKDTNIINRTINELKQKGIILETNKNVKYGGLSKKSFVIDINKVKEAYGLETDLWKYHITD